MRTLKWIARGVCAVGAAMLAASPVAARDHWVSAWGTAQQLAPSSPPPRPPAPAAAQGESVRTVPTPPPPAYPSPILPTPSELQNQTVRMVLRPTIGGKLVRVQFSNASGGQPPVIGQARIARSARNGATVPDTDRPLRFGGRSAVTIQPGAVAVSDPVEISIAPLELLAVSIHLPEKTAVNTVHPLGLRSTYVIDGDRTADTTLTGAAINRSYLWLMGLEVLAPDDAGAIVAFGDSITDGFATTPDAGRAWPDLLAERLQGSPGTRGLSVINMGISGNRIRRDGAGLAGLTRFDRDMLARPGVRWVILLEGINDINFPAIPGIPASEAVTAEDLIAAYSQFIERAHLHGIKVMGATITPTQGLWLYSEKTETIRTTVNDWIRSSGKFDAVVDFDAAVRDPEQPNRLDPRFDPGDHVHPNDAGNAAMAAAIDIAQFTRRCSSLQSK